MFASNLRLAPGYATNGVAAVLGIAGSAYLTWGDRDAQLRPVGIAALLTFLVIAAVVLAQTGAVLVRGARASASAAHSARAGDELTATTHNGALVAISPALGDALGYTEHELVGRDFGELVHPDDRHRSLVDRFLLLDGQAIDARLTRMICAGGEQRLIAWSATLDRRDGLTHLTGRDATHEALESMAIRVTAAAGLQPTPLMWSCTASAKSQH